MKIIKLLAIISVFSLTFFTSCKKDKYQPIGDYGNANIISSNTLTLNNWGTDYDDGTNYTFISINGWGEITQDILDNGILMTYLKVGSEWVALPYASDGTNYSLNFNYSFEVGTLNIYADGWESTGSPNPSDFNGTVIRAVIITQENRAAHPEVDLKNYNEVKKAFILK